MVWLERLAREHCKLPESTAGSCSYDEGTTPHREAAIAVAMKGTMQKIVFQLEVIDDYPPVSAERMWAEPLPDGTYRVRNIPFYSHEVCLDDEVSVTRCTEGTLRFEAVVKPSGNSTVRVIFMQSGYAGMPAVLDAVTALGCTWEGCSTHFVALNIAPTVSLDAVLALLDVQFEQGCLDYESGLLRQ